MRGVFCSGEDETAKGAKEARRGREEELNPFVSSSVFDFVPSAFSSSAAWRPAFPKARSSQSVLFGDTRFSSLTARIFTPGVISATG